MQLLSVSHSGAILRRTWILQNSKGRNAYQTDVGHSDSGITTHDTIY
jgi:hypothetical protein